MPSALTLGRTLCSNPVFASAIAPLAPAIEAGAQGHPAGPLTLVAHPSFPAHSVKAFIAFARARPSLFHEYPAEPVADFV